MRPHVSGEACRKNLRSSAFGRWRCESVRLTDGYVEPAIGIEPMTCGLRNRCSTPELRWPNPLKETVYAAPPFKSTKRVLYAWQDECSLHSPLWARLLRSFC